MAIAATSIVAVKISSGQLVAGGVCAQPPAFGTVDGGSAPWNVTWWGSGNRTTAIPDASLDEITTASTPVLALIGQLVNSTGFESAYSSVVVGAYKRSTVDYVLLKSVSTGAFREVLPSTVAAVSG